MKQFSSERHHWWPKVLSAHWADESGKVWQVLPDGTSRHERPESFGIDRHTHNIRLGTPWNSSFEEQFGVADCSIPQLVEWLTKLEALTLPSREIKDRMLGHRVTTDQLLWLAACLASLIVRSPAMRHRIQSGVEGSRKLMGLRDFQADKTLIALNMRPLFENHMRHMTRAGKFAILFSPDQEFIFGDGFFQNFQPLF